MADMNTSEFGDYDNVTNVPDFTRVSPTIIALRNVIQYVLLALGVPGNVLSAIVWLRRGSNNSSAVYLAALAINDLAFLFLYFLENSVCGRDMDALCGCCVYLRMSTLHLESLLVLGFSVERLIAILRPLQVCCMFVANFVKAQATLTSFYARKYKQCVF